MFTFQLFLKEEGIKNFPFSCVIIPRGKGQDGWMDGWTDGRTDGWGGGWMDMGILECHASTSEH